jgi:glycosyltransferase involved in cell wall biosynthesis
VLTDDSYANWIRGNAYKRIREKYDWDKIAQQTKTIYNNVLNEYTKSFWAQPITHSP